MSDLLVGVDLGGTTTTLGLVSPSGMTQGDLLTISTEVAAGPELAVARIAQSLSSLRLGLRREDKIAGIGLACPGPLDQARGILLNPPNLKGWEDFPIVKKVADATGISRVCLENDANAAALGEYWRGSGRGSNCMLLLTLGTGVGGGVVLDGQLWSGPGGTAGELGHFSINPDGPPCQCGNYGCLEAYASAAAIQRRAQDIAEAEPRSLLANAEKQLTPKDIHDLAIQGDDASRKVFEYTGRFVGVALAGLVNIFDPDVIVLVGGVAGAIGLMKPAIEQEIRSRAFPQPAERVRVLSGALGTKAGPVGAAAVFLQREGRLARPWVIDRLAEPVFVRAIHIGRAGTQAGIVQISGDEYQVLSRASRRPQAEDREGIVDKSIDCVKDALHQSGLPKGKIAGTGIATPGPLDRREKRLLDVPMMGWARTNLDEEFRGLTGRLYVDNDADAAAAAELKFGEARSVDDFLLLYVGTGIGAGIAIEGRVHRGFRSTAGEIGHLTINHAAEAPYCACGNRGCLEAYVNGQKLVRDVTDAVRAGTPTAVRAQALSGHLSYMDVCQAADEGDQLCRRLLEDMGRPLGAAVASYLNLLNPRKVIVAGPFARAWRHFGERLGLEVKNRAFSEARQGVPVVPTTFGDDSDLVAAAAVFAEQWEP